MNFTTLLMPDALPAALVAMVDACVDLPQLERPLVSPSGRWCSWSYSADPARGRTTAGCAILRSSPGAAPAYHDGWSGGWWTADELLVVITTQQTMPSLLVYDPERGVVTGPGRPWSGPWPCAAYGRGLLRWRLRLRAPGTWFVDGEDLVVDDLWWLDLITGEEVNLTVALPPQVSWSSVIPAPEDRQLLLNGSRGNAYDCPEAWLLSLSGSDLAASASTREPIALRCWRRLPLPPLAAVVDWSPGGDALLLNFEPGRVHLRGEPYQLWIQPLDGMGPLSPCPMAGEHLLNACWTAAGLVTLSPRGTRRELLQLERPGVDATPVAAGLDQGQEPVWRGIAAGDLIITSFSASRTGVILALALAADGRPTLLRGEPAPGLEVVATVSPHPWSPPGPWRLERWRSVDGVMIEGILRLPPAGQGPPPLLVVLKGGPATNDALVWMDPGLHRLAWPIPAFLASGIAVLSVNYRGSSGYGSTFEQADGAGRTIPGLLAVRDIEHGIAHLSQQGVIDERRVGMAGWSYGGMLTALACGHSSCFRALSVGAGVTDHLLYHLVSDHPEWEEHLFGGPPTSRRRAYDDASPVRGVHAQSPPTLIQHGDGDRPVSVLQAVTLHRALKALGIPVVFQRFPGLGHGLPWESPDAARAVAMANLAWFRHHLLQEPDARMDTGGPPLA